MGFKYLGYFLKPLGYRVRDWHWLVQKFKRKISNWTYKLLSLRGRLILVQSVLSSLLVYWLGLVPIPASILHKLRSMMFAFLWGSSETHRKFHLASWQSISWPKEYQGRGINFLHWFSISLRLKNLWLVLMNEGLWNRVITAKYLHNQSVASWLQYVRFNTRRVSIIWRGFIQTLSWLGGHLAWQVGMGINIWIGVDPIAGKSSPYSLPAELRSFLEDLDIRTLSQAHNTLPDAQHYWYTAEELGIAGEWKEVWDDYTAGLA